MTYNKPRLKVNDAITAIHYVDCKCEPIIVDCCPGDPLYPMPEAPAYQADE